MARYRRKILELPPKRHFLRLHILQDAAQQIAEQRKRLLGLMPALAAHQHHDGVQGVEQKMRLKLRFQGA